MDIQDLWGLQESLVQRVPLVVRVAKALLESKDLLGSMESLARLETWVMQGHLGGLDHRVVVVILVFQVPEDHLERLENLENLDRSDLLGVQVCVDLVDLLVVLESQEIRGNKDFLELRDLQEKRDPEEILENQAFLGKTVVQGNRESQVQKEPLEERGQLDLLDLRVWTVPWGTQEIKDQEALQAQLENEVQWALGVHVVIEEILVKSGHLALLVEMGN